MSTDPFAHGTPVGDDHTWVDPGQIFCPDCECCTIRLCRTAVERGRTCDEVGDSGPGVMDLRGCPCSAPSGVSDVD